MLGSSSVRRCPMRSTLARSSASSSVAAASESSGRRTPAFGSSGGPAVGVTSVGVVVVVVASFVRRPASSWASSRLRGRRGGRRRRRAGRAVRRRVRDVRVRVGDSARGNRTREHGRGEEAEREGRQDGHRHGARQQPPSASQPRHVFLRLVSVRGFRYDHGEWPEPTRLAAGWALAAAVPDCSSRVRHFVGCGTPPRFHRRGDTTPGWADRPTRTRGRRLKTPGHDVEFQPVEAHERRAAPAASEQFPTSRTSVWWQHPARSRSWRRWPSLPARST